jgi:hypothetical protein
LGVGVALAIFGLWMLFGVRDGRESDAIFDCSIQDGVHLNVLVYVPSKQDDKFARVHHEQVMLSQRESRIYFPVIYVGYSNQTDLNAPMPNLDLLGKWQPIHIGSGVSGILYRALFRAVDYFIENTTYRWLLKVDTDALVMAPGLRRVIERLESKYDPLTTVVGGGACISSPFHFIASSLLMSRHFATQFSGPDPWNRMKLVGKTRFDDVGLSNLMFEQSGGVSAKEQWGLPESCVALPPIGPEFVNASRHPLIDRLRPSEVNKLKPCGVDTRNYCRVCVCRDVYLRDLYTLHSNKRPEWVIDLWRALKDADRRVMMRPNNGLHFEFCLGNATADI